MDSQSYDFILTLLLDQLNSTKAAYLHFEHQKGLPYYLRVNPELTDELLDEAIPGISDNLEKAKLAYEQLLKMKHTPKPNF